MSQSDASVALAGASRELIVRVECDTLVMVDADAGCGQTWKWAVEVDGRRRGYGGECSRQQQSAKTHDGDASVKLTNSDCWGCNHEHSSRGGSVQPPNCKHVKSDGCWTRGREVTSGSGWMRRGSRREQLVQTTNCGVKIELTSSDCWSCNRKSLSCRDSVGGSQTKRSDRGCKRSSWGWTAQPPHRRLCQVRCRHDQADGFEWGELWVDVGWAGRESVAWIGLDAERLWVDHKRISDDVRMRCKHATHRLQSLGPRSQPLELKMDSATARALAHR
ncbi:hypothetical protein SCLCIDRAFT_1116669 [Scleroderma citrinum Foug A]|uniref:Uncharacterized protein n=1 Tax=Scleroderma citrinum Foug A TaxID=1036808 RepID=A0A0C3DP67_9AGAM|nr:hypothetical protein SCLCIDRAFT_1116669 [Scleroderma citrinum Foug A]